MKTSARRDPIAIVGIGCRFPGGIADPESFWRVLRDGIDTITEIPTDRFDVEALYQEGEIAPGRIATRRGGFIEGIDRFDAAFFGISAREADRLDPQQRLLLETSWEAIEDAGQSADALVGSRTGVFVGLWMGDYEARFAADPAANDLYLAMGGGRYAASGRISYALGLQGPSLTLDTACSSSLVAVHLACQSLRNGECELALAGGANVILQPYITIAYSQSGMLAADGRCKFGDAKADGYVRSEGAGMVLLKPLTQALADGDPIYAVIRGSAVNNDGRSGDSLVKPAQHGQQEMLRQAYQDAGISPGEVHYVEAHGTGTRAGDPTELAALGTVLAEGRPEGRLCPVGSVKPHVGHTEAAAGVAGLIRAALVLRHREMPATLHLDELNPRIPWSELPLFIPTERVPLPADASPAFAGVNSFGISGTNAHVVLEEWVEREAWSVERLGMHPAGPVLIPLSARAPGALQALTQRWVEQLSAGDPPRLADLAYTAARRRAHHEQRLAVVAQTPEELLERLRTFGAGEMAPGIATGQMGAATPKIVFVFPGQGSQWLGMGRELLAGEPVFRAALEECEAAMRPFVEWSLIGQLTTDEGAPSYLLDRIDVVQPTLVSLAIALARLWRHWGIEPAAVVGHSMGEVAAACVAGALSLEDAMRVICMRSKLLRRASGGGAMAAVELPREAAEAALAGYEERVTIAASNSPRSTILSGETAALEEILSNLQQQDVYCRPVKVDVASHSPQMDPLRDDLLAGLEGIAPRPASVPFHSTVLDRALTGTELGPAYWERNLRQPVLFTEAVLRLLQEERPVFLEVSPHPVLLPAIQQTLQHTGRDALALGSLRREEEERATLLQVLGELYVAGCDLAWEQIYPVGSFVRLPAYPWQRERYWYEPARHPASRQYGKGVHPLAGEVVSTATGHQVWEGELSTTLLPYLADHRVRGEAVVPAAAYLEMALAAAHEFGPDTALEDFSFEEAILLGKEQGTGWRVQVIVEPDSAQAATLQVFSRAPGGAAEAWTRNVRGRLVMDPAPAPASAPSLPPPGAPAVPGSEHYARVRERGLEYGENFQGIAECWREADAVVGRICLPERMHAGSDRYRIHPVLLDSCLQLLLQCLDGGSDPDALYLPVAVRRLRLHSQPDPATVFYARAGGCRVGNDLAGEVFLYDATGQPVLTLEGVRLRRVSQESEREIQNCFFAVEWERRPRAAASAPDRSGSWLLLADSSGVAAELAARLESAGEICMVARPGVEYRQLGASSFELDPQRVADFERLLAAAAPGDRSLQGIVHLWSLDAPLPESASADDLEAAQTRGTISLLHLVQALAQRAAARAPRICLATRGAQRVIGESDLPAAVQAPLWGMSSVLANEHPELRPTCIDLDPADPAAGVALAAELLAADAENRIALRSGERYVARLVRRPDLGAEAPDRTGGDRRIAAPYGVATTGAGVLDNLQLRPIPRRSPGPGEVEIEVRAVGLNFMNVMSAMGMYPGYPGGMGPLGIECAGVVTAVGDGVNELTVGDEVVAVAFDSLATHALADARLVARKPPRLGWDEAATIPIVFLTAVYALEHLAHLSAGERVLIHSASGGVGLAAIQLARRAGAEIFATAGTPEKRAYLHTLGIEQVFDSRSLSFAEEILERTGGEGVDVVLNSLAGEAVGKGLAILRPYGRFLEIGKRDIQDNSRVGLAPFRNHLSYFAIDLDRGARERPALLGGLLREIMARVEAGELAPLPRRLLPVSQVAEAFREMARARHIGKIVIGIEDPVAVPGSVRRLRADATYLITGGLGGLGLRVGRWMAEQGARNLVLLGRSCASPAARAAVAEIESLGAQVVIVQADVAEEADVARILGRIAAEMPPLRGVIHAAGLLADATVLEMDRQRFLQAMAPKLRGAWNLHRLTSDQPLDFFVLFSSVASVLGTAGQANYAAANAFLDSLAQARRARGLPALSLNWGTWGEVGLAAAQADRGARLAAQGLRSLTPTEGVEALSRILHTDAAQVAVMRLDVERWCAVHPAAASSPLLSALRVPVESDAAPLRPGSGIREALLQSADGEGEGRLEAHLRERVAQVLRLAPARVALNSPFQRQGMDSLMTLELRNRLEADLGIPVSATVIWNYPTVTRLARHLYETLLDRHDAAGRERAEVSGRDGAGPPRKPEGAASADLEALLEQELTSIEQLLGGD